MFAQERQQSIAEKIKAEGRVRVAQLAAQFAVTEDCIRKDLTVLEKQGLARKTYGGAVRVRENPHLYSSRDRRSLPDPERLGIVQKAMSLIHADDLVYLDVSNTSLELAEAIARSGLRVTVMTNMIAVLNLLSSAPAVTVLFPGGQMNPERDGFWGSMSQQAVRSFRLDLAFLGTVGIDAENGTLSTYQIDDGMMKQAVIAQSRRVYVYAELHKFQQEGSCVYARLQEVTGLILGGRPEAALARQLAASGVETLWEEDHEHTED
jgi:DeoR family glycerol-3-phosphate regulon repressor